MYKRFKLSNFRCFEELELNDLARVNLIAGRNNVGKTALLEALFIHVARYNPELALRLNNFRGLSRGRVQFPVSADTPWGPLFGQFDITKEIVIAGEETSNGVKSIRLKVINDPEELKDVRITLAGNGKGTTNLSSTSKPVQVFRLEYSDKEGEITAHLLLEPDGITQEGVIPSPFQSVFLAARSRPPLDEEASRFTNLVNTGHKDLLLKTLKILESRLVNLELLTFMGETLVHAHVGTSRPIPLIYMGDGLVRLASLVAAIAFAQDGVVLVDEIENGLHHSVLEDIWKAIGLAAHEFNTQVFATTHSWECIVAAHEAFSETDYDFRYHRLDRTADDRIRVVTYDQETLEASIDINLETR